MLLLLLLLLLLLRRGGAKTVRHFRAVFALPWQLLPCAKQAMASGHLARQGPCHSLFCPAIAIFTASQYVWREQASKQARGRMDITHVENDVGGNQSIVRMMLRMM